MSDAVHERARRLLASWLAGDVAPGDREWLEEHLAGCPRCARLRGRMERALSGVGLPHVEVDERLLAATRLRMRAHGAPAADEAVGPVLAASLLGFVLSIASVWGLWSLVPGATAALVPVSVRVYLTTAGAAFAWSLAAAVVLWLLPAALVGLALALFNPRPGRVALLWR